MPDTESLYRLRALQALTQQPLGVAAWVAPKAWSRITLLLLASSLLGGAFVHRAEFTHKATARGWLVAKEGGVQVHHHTTARVNKILVGVGDVVAAEDNLLYLTSEVALTNGRGKAAMALQHIDAIDDEFAMQELVLQERATEERRLLQSQLASAQRQLRNRVAEQEQLTRQATVVAEKLARLQRLFATGAIAEWDILQQRERREELQLQRLRQQRVLDEKKQHLLNLKHELQQHPAKIAMQRSELRVRRERLQNERSDHESQQTAVLRSPIAGRVATLNTRQGQTVAARQTLLTILPCDTELIAEIFVPSRAAGFIVSGQSVALSLDAYPQRRFGSIRGEVLEVSEFVFLPREIPQTFAVNEATYRVRVAVHAPAAIIDENRPRLRAGMLLSASVTLDRRSLLSRLIDPLQRFRSARH